MNGLFRPRVHVSPHQGIPFCVFMRSGKAKHDIMQTLERQRSAYSFDWLIARSDFPLCFRSAANALHSFICNAPLFFWGLSISSSITEELREYASKHRIVTQSNTNTFSKTKMCMIDFPRGRTNGFFLLRNEWARARTRASWEWSMDGWWLENLRFGDGGKSGCYCSSALLLLVWLRLNRNSIFALAMMHGWMLMRPSAREQ